MSPRPERPDTVEGLAPIFSASHRISAQPCIPFSILNYLWSETAHQIGCISCVTWFWQLSCRGLSRLQQVLPTCWQIMTGHGVRYIMPHRKPSPWMTSGRHHSCYPCAMLCRQCKLDWQYQVPKITVNMLFHSAVTSTNKLPIACRCCT